MIESYRSPALGGLIETLTSTAPAVSLRLNRMKTGAVTPGVAAGASRPVPWAPAGCYLDQRPRFTLDPAFHQGLYYVQDASSMFIGRVAGQAVARLGDRPLTVVDGCAAPGGKTTAVIDVLPGGSVVVANEFVPARAAVLVENLVKWGYPDVIVTRGDTARLKKPLKEQADIVVADVPCSGEGMMRKEPEAVAQWSQGLVGSMARLQREIVENLWETLRPGGFLIYSTCTFNRVENEENVEWIVSHLGGEPVAVDTSQWPQIAPAIDSSLPCCRFIPGRVEGEGLFMALLRKPGNSDTTPRPEKTRSKRRVEQKTDLKPCRGWLGGEFIMSVDGDRIVACSEAVAALKARMLAARVDVIYAGVEMASIKGRDIIPAQALAMSMRLAPDAFCRVEVDRDTALDYLARMAITLPEGTQRGFVLLTHGGHPLGFVKNIGNRANNLYPNPWRILHR